MLAMHVQDPQFRLVVRGRTRRQCRWKCTNEHIRVLRWNSSRNIQRWSKWFEYRPRLEFVCLKGATSQWHSTNYVKSLVSERGIPVPFRSLRLVPVKTITIIERKSKSKREEDALYIFSTESAVISGSINRYRHITYSMVGWKETTITVENKNKKTRSIETDRNSKVRLNVTKSSRWRRRSKGNRDRKRCCSDQLLRCIRGWVWFSSELMCICRCHSKAQVKQKVPLFSNEEEGIDPSTNHSSKWENDCFFSRSIRDICNQSSSENP